MSRGSQGGLEVEKYIGSCLISSTTRPNVQKLLTLKKDLNQSQNIRNTHCYSQQGNEQCQYGTWTGAPLISMTSSPRKNINNQQLSTSPIEQQLQQQQQQNQQIHHQQQHQQHQQIQSISHLQSRSPLSRLAIHTQGAPLILSGRFHNRGKIQNCSTGVVTNNININNSNNVSNYFSVNNNSNNTNNNNNTMLNGRCVAKNQKNIVEVGKKVQINQQTGQSNQSVNQKNECQTNKLDNSGVNIANIDSLSITSDESSNNCENSLPRIIKPRKRRKKDRKPTNVTSQDVTKPEGEHGLSSNPGLSEQANVSSTLKPYVPVCYETRYEPPAHRIHRRPPVTRESYGRTQTSMQETVDTRQRYAHRHAQVKVLDDNRNVVVPASVRTIGLAKGYRNHQHHHHHHHHHHPGNNTVNRSVNNNNNTNSNRYVHDYDICEKSSVIDDPTGLCQCRYCDPSGLIWDVDQNGYSPFLTPPHSNNTPNNVDYNTSHFPQLPIYLSRPADLPCPDQTEYYDIDHTLQNQQHHHHHSHLNQQNHHHHQQQQQQQQHQIVIGSNRNDRFDSTGGILLRRSWSDPSSYFSDQITTPSRDIGVIGDRGQTSELGRGRSSWPGSPSYVSFGTNASGLSALSNPSVVGSQSLEVSTEIVTSHNGHRDLEIKFFSSSPSAVQPEEEKLSLLDDNDDYIWSYHESKLQQDFRTLLQAEE